MAHGAALGQTQEPAAALSGEATSEAGELSLPYSPYRGEALPVRPHAPADVPPPLGRARELPRRPFELGASFGVSLPSCEPGSIDDRRCATLGTGRGFDVSVLYRVSPYFAVGGELTFGSFELSRTDADAAQRSSGRFLGTLGRVYFAESGMWDPYLGLTLGVGSLEARATELDPSLRERASGFGARISGGVDFLLGTHLRLGPSVAFAHWISWQEERCSGAVCRSEALSYGRLAGFASAGLRLTGSFGPTL